MAQAVVTVIENHPSCPLDLLEDAINTCVIDVVRPYLGDAVPSVGDVGDGLIVLGGYQSALSDDDFPWLPRVRALMVSCVDAEVPLLGVCLGAQLLAVACGGTIDIDAAPGLEAGVTDVHWSPDAITDPLFGRIARCCNPLPVPSMHFDAIGVLPDGAVLLGSSAQYTNQVFRVGQRAWGVQFHPEASFCTFRAWATDAAMQESMSPNRFLTEYKEREPHIAATAQMVGKSFAGVVLSSAR
ncbi:type 1 glutamine amidotransferase [Hoyosella rhizosphaerae]|uniref:Aminotransferase n=1 Tax=Hoyosella rhizosphaerae TaxID=1755582 RepID=A0A916X7R6_9ACTN|nr:type 1 glutamine amidotransferase [Hoyosella rhizosphaerae]MBN4927265.1 type 1 glutamine amidotransferase [Hoyosella rhizosphaerae]GGC52638.1 aminotransferase [Hoyosella rhizosphaerae]